MPIRYRHLFSLVLITCLIFLQAPLHAGSMSLVLNGQNVSGLDQDLEVRNNRTYVPLRFVSEALGYHVTWHEKSRLVEIRHRGKEDLGLNVSPKSYIQIMACGKLLPSNSSAGEAYLKNNRTMVPIRLVAENLGAEVRWNEDLNRVEIWQKAVDGDCRSYEYHKAADLTLRGPALVPIEQMEAYLAYRENQMREKASQNGKVFVPFPENIAKLYYEVGKVYHIRGDVALAQDIIETGYFQYGNEVFPEQNNYCGLGAVGRVTRQEDIQRHSSGTIDGSRAWLLENTHGLVV